MGGEELLKICIFLICPKFFYFSDALFQWDFDKKKKKSTEYLDICGFLGIHLKT